MAGLPTVPRLRLVLENDDLLGSSVACHIGNHLRALHRGRTHCHFALVVVHQKDAVQLNCVTLFDRKLFDLKGLPGLDPVLLAACFYYSVDGPVLLSFIAWLV